MLNSQVLVWLYFIAELWGREGHYHKLSPKKSVLKLKHPKTTWQILPPKRIRELKISNPRKSFDHPHRLKSRVPPPPPGLNALFFNSCSTNERGLVAQDLPTVFVFLNFFMSDMQKRSTERTWWEKLIRKRSVYYDK